MALAHPKVCLSLLIGGQTLSCQRFCSLNQQGVMSLILSAFGYLFFMVGSGVFDNKGLTGSPVLIRMLRSSLATSVWCSWYHASASLYQISVIRQPATLETISVRLLVAYLKRFVISLVVIVVLLFTHVVTVWLWCLIGFGVESTFSVFLLVAGKVLRFCGGMVDKFSFCSRPFVEKEKNCQIRAGNARKYSVSELCEIDNHGTCGGLFISCHGLGLYNCGDTSSH